MTTPIFVDGVDKTTFAPFELIDALDTKWSDIRLSFNDWNWFDETHGTDTIDDYYMNGHGLLGLVLASRAAAGLEAYPEGLEPNSEADTCYMHFSDLETAVETARLGQEMISDRKKLEATIIVAREHDLED